VALSWRKLGADISEGIVRAMFVEGASGKFVRGGIERNVREKCPGGIVGEGVVKHTERHTDKQTAFNQLYHKLKTAEQKKTVK